MKYKGKEKLTDWRIISGKLKGEISFNEEKLFTDWLNSSLKHRHFFNKALLNDTTDPGIGLDKELLELKKEELLFRLNNRESNSLFIKKFFRYAAMLIVPIALAIGFLWVNNTKEIVPVISENMIQPGESKAVLILNDGKKINVDSLPQILKEKDGSNIMARKDKLVYTAQKGKELIYNELVVPKGGEYELELSDGTKIWLNSASKIKYPVAFDNEKREVFLEGEAYFEVQKDKKRPFRVFCNEVEVKVYGTRFNVNSHDKAKIQTVLVEGSVGIRLQNNTERRLSPNQLAEYSVLDKSISIKNVDVSRYVAWRYGEFVFEEETIEEIMERLSLWYDTEVFYQNPELKNVHFTGSMKRYDSIDKLLKFIEETGDVKFRIKGRSVTVYKK